MNAVHRRRVPLLVAGVLTVALGAATVAYATGSGNPTADQQADRPVAGPADDVTHRPSPDPSSEPDGSDQPDRPAGEASPSSTAPAADRPSPAGQPSPAAPSLAQALQRLAPELSPQVRQRVLALAEDGPLDETGALAPPQVPQLMVVQPPHADSLADPSTQQVFDIDRFEANIRDALAGQTVGYAYSIGREGKLHHADGVGAARTAVDAPAIDQSPDKPMTVASISKPITAVAVLRLLEQEGISVDDAIGPWLPSAWDRGVGVDEITFAELMTHRSGLRQSYELATGKGGKVTAAYDNIRLAVSQDVGDTSAMYANMNFSIFRLIVPKLLGYDFSAEYDDPPQGLTSETINLLYGAIFDAHVAGMLAPVGVTASCASWDEDPTLLYRFPDERQQGWDAGPYLLGCGGYGMFVSANGLTGFLSYLRYTDLLLSPQSRHLMNDGRLGWQSYSGAHGTYLGHGGDWSTGRGMSGCVMSFHIHVDASLLINSRGGDRPHPCTVLRQAFDSAWVPAQG